MAETTYVLAISNDNTRFHVGVLEEFVPHLDDGGPLLPQVELYSDKGEPLELTTDQGGVTTIGLVQGAAAADGRVLVDRIALALAHAQMALNNEAAGNGAAEGISPIPQLRGELRVVLAGLAAYFGPMNPPPNQGGRRHNWQHDHGCAVH
jgi:hypothetical protein